MESSPSPEPETPESAESAQPSPPSSERVCPSCSAPAEPKQRWCLECGHELPQSRRPALRSAVGIATTLTVLVGAASAGGYTLLQDGKEAPPPTQTQTIAQTPPPTTPTVPPIDTVPTTPTVPPLPNAGRGSRGGTGGGAVVPSTPPPAPPPVDTSVPDITPEADPSPPPPPPDDAPDVDPDGSVRDGGTGRQDRPQRQPRPRLTESNLAFGSPALAYAPYAEGFPDLGEPGFVTDGSTRSVWRTPRFEDPTLQPQMGVYVELGDAERIRRLVLKTPTPGMSVEIYASRRANPPASITDPGWAHLTDRTNVSETTSIPLAGTGRWRYVLVWIRSLPPDTDHAEISEIELVGLAPE